ncbi:MAG: HipA domain-containing protein [Acidimicrobiales bacterium]
MPSPTSEAYVWAWLPSSTEPVVAGILQRRGTNHRFAYARSYRERPDAISLYEPELPLREGWIEPREGLTIAGAIRDAGPDAWGQRVIIEGLYGDPRAVDPGDIDQLTYLLESASNRIGALDFQHDPERYVARQGSATLDELHGAAMDLVEGRDLAPELAKALIDGTAVGGARPKVVIEDHGRSYIAKLSVSTDPYPLVKAEAVGLELARRVGIEVPPARLTRSLGRDVLLVERFDRVGGARRLVVSGLTMVGLDEMFARHATYPDILDVLRRRGSDPDVGRRLFERIVCNIAIGNNDDHARNHAAFWDGTALTLSPAYDLCPQPRSGETSYQAMAIGREGEARASSLATCVEAAPIYGIDRSDALDVVNAQLDTISEAWDDVAEACELTKAQRGYLFGRQVLNPSITYGLPTSPSR